MRNKIVRKTLQFLKIYEPERYILKLPKERVLIEYHGCRQEYLKPQYREAKVLKGMPLVAIYVWLDPSNKYGYTIELKDFHKSMEDMWKPSNPKERKLLRKIADKLKRRVDDDKPVDTSSWVHPDRETLHRELVGQLALLEVLQEGNDHHTEALARANVLYSVLHSHSPRNPQSLTNFANPGHHSGIENILSELGHPEASTVWRLMDTVKGPDGKFDWWEWLKQSQEWKENVRANTIFPRYEPPSAAFKEKMRAGLEKYKHPTLDMLKTAAELQKAMARDAKKTEARAKKIARIKEQARRRFGVTPYWEQKRLNLHLITGTCHRSSRALGGNK